MLGIGVIYGQWRIPSSFLAIAEKPRGAYGFDFRAGDACGHGIESEAALAQRVVGFGLRALAVRMEVRPVGGALDRISPGTIAAKAAWKFQDCNEPTVLNLRPCGISPIALVFTVPACHEAFMCKGENVGTESESGRFWLGGRP